MYWRYATRSLGRGGQHTLFAIFCVAVGVMVIVALQLVGLMVNAALTGNIRAFNGGDLAVHAETGIGEGQLSYFAELESKGTITAYSPATIDEATTPSGGGLQRVSFWAIDPATFPLAGTMPVITPSGGETATLLQRQGSAVATDTLMGRLHLHIGDTLPLTISSGRAGSVTIAGEIATSGVISDRADLLISRQTYASFVNLTGSPAVYGWVFINVPGHSDAAAAQVAAQVHQQFPELDTTTVPQAQQQAQSEIDGIRTFLRIIGLLALLIGGVGIINTMQVLLRRRLLEIAMLKTQGYRQRHLLLMFGIEALLLGAIGGVVGALLGIGLSFLVQALVERAFFLTIPTIIDPLTVASGVAIGVVTTLIFGLLPIVRTSAVRPLAVLREMGTEGARGSRLATVGLLLLLGILFFLLALGILGNLTVALAVVVGAGLALGLLTAFFSLVVGVISHWPVPSLRRGVSLLALVPFLLLGLLLHLSAGFGVLLLALVAVGLLVAFLPRAAQAETQLALRNIGRARVRSATTLVALFVGVFAIGLGLVLGQNLKDFIASRNAAVNQDNAYVLANSQDAPLVAAQLGKLPSVSHEQVSLAAPARLIAINGQPAPTTSVQSETANLTGINGFDLAKGSLPPATLTQGAQDARAGRLLNASDAGTLNAVFPLSESDAPDKLKLGDQVVLSSLDGKTTRTLHVVGFYTGLGTFAGLSAILTDRGAAMTLSNGHPYSIFAVRLPPAAQSQDLQTIKQAVPGVITLGDAATLNDINTILDNIVQVIEMVASLAMFAGLVLIANTVALAMLERRRELGILKAIGHTSHGILGMVLAEQGVLAMVGAYSALLVVSVAATVLTQITFHSTVGTSGSVPLTLALAAATATLCLLVAGSVAWRTTRIRPIEVLRYE